MKEYVKNSNGTKKNVKKDTTVVNSEKLLESLKNALAAIAPEAKKKLQQLIPKYEEITQDLINNRDNVTDEVKENINQFFIQETFGKTTDICNKIQVINTTINETTVYIKNCTKKYKDPLDVKLKDELKAKNKELLNQEKTLRSEYSTLNENIQLLDTTILKSEKFYQSFKESIISSKSFNNSPAEIEYGEGYIDKEKVALDKDEYKKVELQEFDNTNSQDLRDKSSLESLAMNQSISDGINPSNQDRFISVEQEEKQNLQVKTINNDKLKSEPLASVESGLAIKESAIYKKEQVLNAGELDAYIKKVDEVHNERNKEHAETIEQIPADIEETRKSIKLSIITQIYKNTNLSDKSLEEQIIQLGIELNGAEDSIKGEVIQEKLNELKAQLNENKIEKDLVQNPDYPKELISQSQEKFQEQTLEKDHIENEKASLKIQNHEKDKEAIKKVLQNSLSEQSNSVKERLLERLKKKGKDPVIKKESTNNIIELDPLELYEQSKLIANTARKVFEADGRKQKKEIARRLDERRQKLAKKKSGASLNEDANLKKAQADKDTVYDLSDNIGDNLSISNGQGQASEEKGQALKENQKKNKEPNNKKARNREDKSYWHKIKFFFRRFWKKNTKNKLKSSTTNIHNNSTDVDVQHKLGNSITNQLNAEVNKKNYVDSENLIVSPKRVLQNPIRRLMKAFYKNR